jgi:hypothetical protein
VEILLEVLGFATVQTSDGATTVDSVASDSDDSGFWLAARRGD